MSGAQVMPCRGSGHGRWGSGTHLGLVGLGVGEVGRLPGLPPHQAPQVRPWGGWHVGHGGHGLHA